MSMKVTYRKIAIVMTKKFPTASDDDFNSKVNEYIEAMERLPLSQQLAMKAAYIFAALSPPEIREDCFQDFYLAVHLKNTNDEALAYTVARRRWISKINQYKRRQEILNGHDLGQSTGCEDDCITRVESSVDVGRVWQGLPDKIKHIALKRLNQQALTSTERSRLTRFNKYNGHKIRALVRA